MRYAITKAAAGDTIQFSSSLNGRTITLSGTELKITKVITIDASALSNGITINANQKSRVFSVSSGTNANPVQFKKLTITGGKAASAAANDGGGVFLTFFGALSMTNCSIIGNSASDDGGGIYKDSGTLSLVNCRISGNTATDAGGGIYNSFTGSISLANCMIAGNTATGDGGGVYNDLGTLTMTNCIAAMNYNGNILGKISTASRNNLVGANPGFVVSPIFNDSGILTNSRSINLRLTESSWAINAGTNDVVKWNDVDLNGAARIYDSIVDLGAYEYDASSPNREAVSFVVSAEDDSFDATDGKTSLREAIFNAATGDTITFHSSLDGKTLTLNGDEFAIMKEITIDASSLPGGIVIDAEQKSRVFKVTGGTSSNPVQFKNLTLTGGIALNGGGIYNYGAITLTNCSIAGNTVSQNGGGIFNASYGAITLTNCSIAGNAASQNGGGIFNASYAAVTLTNCSIVENNAGQGGGIYNSNAITLTGCSIVGNVATTHGGGISNLYNAVLTLTNCTVAGNAASQNGGGIRNYATLNLINSIVAMNYNGNIFDGVLSPTSRNYIVGGISGFVVAPEFDDSGTLTNFESIDLRLSPTSWAINAGTNDVVVEGAVDLDGNPRFYGTNVDIGAYEYQETVADREAVSLVVSTKDDSFDATDGKTSLREAIFNAATGDAITFHSALDGETVTLAGDELVITKGITIDASSLADGIAIDADQKSRVFSIFGGDENIPVQIKNLTVNEGKAYSGGGIYNFCVLALANCSIVRSASYSGGGIYNIGKLTLTNCSVDENSANGGAGMTNDGTITLSNCSVSGNSASAFGGGFYNLNAGSLTLTNCTVAGNSAFYGGAIYDYYSADSVVTLINSIVATNTATNSGNDIYQFTSGPGAIQGYNNLSSFWNWSGSYGNNYTYDYLLPLFTDAAIGDYSLAANSQAIDQGNNAYALYPDGSAIEFDLAGNPRIFNKVVDIGAFEYMVVYKVTTELDVVDPDDGVLSLREAIAQAASGEIVTFAASLAGKTIVLNGSQLVVDKGIIIDATSLGESGITIDAGGKSSVLNVSGGTEDSPVTLVNLTLTGGKTAWYGGLLYTKDVVSVQNCKFNAGFAYYGGAIANEGTLTVENSSFNDNQGSHGGAIFNRSTGMLTLSGITATTNSATNYGGVLYNNGTATITDSEFQTNSSKNRAGAIYVAAGTVSVVGSTFVDNTATNFGGTVYNAGTFDVSTSSITGGSAIYGGAIANFKTLTVASCDLTNNTATKQGGAIYHSSSIAVNITAGSISDNSAYQGGGLYVRIGTVRLTGTELKSNSVTHNGGAIYSRNQTILTDCVVTDNFAKYYGGGVYNEKTLRVRGTTPVADNATETGKSVDIHTKSGGQIIYDSTLADSLFDETDDWTIEL